MQESINLPGNPGAEVPIFPFFPGSPISPLSPVTICNSYTMVCPPVRGDNPRALAT